MSNKRFIEREEQGWMKGAKIITDTETGVQYLFVNWGSAGGLTLLVDRDGKPLLNKEYVNRL
jgi:hypothetical protein